MSKEMKQAIANARYQITQIKWHIKSDVKSAVRDIERQLVALGLAPTLRVSDTGWMVIVTGSCATRALVLALFKTHGFEPSYDPKDDDKYYSTWLNRSGGDRFWFDFTNTACERVKVGTKMVEQDVYETRCTD